MIDRLIKSLLLILAIFSIFTLSPSVCAQGEEDQTNNSRFWEAKIYGWSYKVALNQITAISEHEYIVDGGGIVTEVNIATAGSALVRFYYMRPLAEEQNENVADKITRMREEASRLASRAGIDAQDKVLKQYPATTHAKTIEYRLLSDETLRALYKSVDKAWTDNRGRTFKLSSE